MQFTKTEKTMEGRGHGRVGTCAPPSGGKESQISSAAKTSLPFTTL